MGVDPTASSVTGTRSTVELQPQSEANEREAWHARTAGKSLGENDFNDGRADQCRRHRFAERAVVCLHTTAIWLSYQKLSQMSCVPVNGIEPLFKAYESFVLPLNYTGDTKTLAKSPHSDNLIRIDKPARLNLPEFFI